MFDCTVVCDIRNNNSFYLFPEIVLMQPVIVIVHEGTLHLEWSMVRLESLVGNSGKGTKASQRFYFKVGQPSNCIVLL